MNIKRYELIQIAEQEIGYVERPINRTKYGLWFGLDCVAWCGMFVSYCYFMAGIPLGNIGYTKGFAGCSTAVTYFKGNKKTVSYSDAEPGDIVFYDFDGNGIYDHTGILYEKINDSHFVAIEGNTSLKDNRNGGQVMKRDRTVSKCLFVKVIG